MHCACLPPPGGKYFASKCSLQKMAHAVIMQEVYRDSPSAHICTLMQRRLVLMFAPFEVDFDDNVNLNVACGMLSHLRPNDSLKIIKTWLNGWATSHRMHEDILLPCLLGCATGEDSLRHYVMCPHMFAFWRFVFEKI